MVLSLPGKNFVGFFGCACGCGCGCGCGLGLGGTTAVIVAEADADADAGAETARFGSGGGGSLRLLAAGSVVTVVVGVMPAPLVGVWFPLNATRPMTRPATTATPAMPNARTGAFFV